MKEEQKISKIKKKRKIIKQKIHEESEQIDISEQIDTSEQSETLEQIQSIDIQNAKTEETTYENLTDLNTEQPNAIKPIISQIPSDNSEIVVLDQIANLAPDVSNQVHATPICQPHVVPVTQEIVASETEEHTPFSLQNTQNSKLVLNENASVETFIVDIVDNAKQMEPISPAPKIQIRPDIKPNESISASEVVTNEDVSELETKPQSTLNAKVTCAPLQAPSISEDVPSEKEGTLTQPRTHAERAKLNLVPKEAIEVAKYDQNEKEGDFIPTESMVNNATCEISSSESVEVTQTFAEFMPNKYYPEIVVATEVASSNVVEHKSYETLEFNAPEKEDTYASDRKPIGQQANAELIKSDAITVEKAEITESTQSLEDLVKPRPENAFGSYTPYEGQQKQIDEYLECGGVAADALVYDTKYANVEVNEQTSNVTEIVHVNESEQEFAAGDISNITTAQTSFTLNESCNQLQPVLHESEAEFISDAKRNFSTAVGELIPYQGLQTESVETIDSVDDLKNMKKPQMTEATIDFEHRLHTESYDVVAHEKEQNFDTKSLPKQMKPNILSDELKSIQVESPNIVEKEGVFESPVLDTKHSSIVPTHSLKLSVQEEVSISLSVDRLDEKKTEQVQAHTHADLLNETLVTTVDINESVGESLAKGAPKSETAESIVDTKTAIEVLAPDVQDMDDILEDYIDLDRHKAIHKPLIMNDSHKSLTVELNDAIDSLDELKTKSPGKSYASIATTDQNETIISESTCLENVSELSSASVVPSGASAKVTMDEDHSLNVMITKTVENEEPFDAHIPTVLKTAIVSLSEPLCHLQTEESNQLLESSSLDEQLRNEATAKVTQSNLQEIGIEEPLVLEETKPYQQSEHEKAVSKPTVEDHRHIFITEQNLPENINILDESKTIHFKIKEIGVSHTLAAASVSETQFEYQNGALDRNHPLESTAHVINDEQKSVQSSETTAFEQASELEIKDHMPEGKANVGYTELTSIIGSGQSPWENECGLKQSQDVINIANKSATHSLKTAQVEETQSFLSTGRIDENKPTDQIHATREQEIHDEIVRMDTVAFESLNIDEFSLKTRDSTATISIEERQHLTTSINNVEEISELLKPMEMKPEHEVHSTATHHLKSVMVEEVSTNEMSSDLSVTTAEKQMIKYTVDALNQAENSQIISCIDTVVDEKRPRNLIEGAKEGVETTAAQVFESEKHLDILKMEPATAQQQINEQHKLSERSEPIIFENVSELSQNIASEKGKVVLEPNIGVQVQQTNDNENVGTTDGYRKPSTCNANINIEGMQSAIEYEMQTIENTGEIEPQQQRDTFAKPTLCAEKEAIIIVDVKPITDELTQIPQEITPAKLANITQNELNKKSLKIIDITTIDSVEKLAPDQHKNIKANLSIEKTHMLPEQTEIYPSEQIQQMKTENAKHHFASKEHTRNTEKYISEEILMESTENIITSTNSKNLEKTAVLSIEETQNKNKTATQMQSTIQETITQLQTTQNINIITEIENYDAILDVSTVRGKYRINRLQVITNKLY